MKVPSATSSTPKQQHAPGADAVGHHAGKRLREAPPQLAEGEGQADAAQAQAGGGVQRAEEQAHATGARPWSAQRCRRRPAAPAHRAQAPCAADCGVAFMRRLRPACEAPAVQGNRRAARAAPPHAPRPAGRSTPAAPASRRAAPRRAWRARPSVMAPAGCGHRRRGHLAPAGAASGLQVARERGRLHRHARARSAGRIGPSRSKCDSSEYCVVFRPGVPTSAS